MKHKDLILTFASVLLLALARLPLHLGFLVFIGWIPLMIVLQEGGRSFKRLLLMGLIWSLVYVGIVFYWISEVTWGGLIGIVGFYAVWLALFFYVIQRIWSRFPAWGHLGFIAVMLSFEYLQNFGETRFPWWNSGYSLAAYPQLIQAADLGGMTLLALLILIINILVDKASRGKLRNLIWIALIMSAWIGYGQYCLTSLQPQKRELRAQVMQPSIPQEDKWEQEHYPQMLARFEELSLKAAADSTQLFIWPEAAMPAYLRYDMDRQRDLREIINLTGLEIFTGFPDFDSAPPEHVDEFYYYNGASLFKPDGSQQPVFHKNILVPVGERMLWLKQFPILWKLNFGQANWEFGKELAYYESFGYRYSPSICYELAFPDIHHRMAMPKDPQTGRITKMDFLVNLTNDAWFGTSYGPWLHQVMTRFRAVENRIQIYRSANTGISVIVDPLGRELASAGLFKITNLGAPLYTVDKVPLIRHIHSYPLLFLILAAGLFLLSLFKAAAPPSKEASG